MLQIVFWSFAGLAVGSALLCVTRRSPVASALWLVLAMFSLAGLYVILDAQFIAAVQVMVYAGAIMVLFLFVILLLNLEEEPGAGVTPTRVASVMAAVTTLGLVLHPLLFAPRSPVESIPALTVPPTAPNVAEILFRQYALPFEIVSLLLLVAMVGAIHLARRPGRTETA